ncbi:MAG TPA: DUF4424 family protein [Allosphingosinicella sp.]
MKLGVTMLASLALAAPAAANDSTAEHAAGGLVLTRSAAINMVSEDLFISAAQVRVRYVFRNVRGRAASIRTTIAFPMPDRDLAAERDIDVAYPADFETRVDGRRVAMAVERKAVLGGVDRTALLAALGLAADADGEALDALAPAEQARLVRLGLAGADEYDAGRGRERRLAPLWTVKETWHWEQSFPAGRDVVVEHLYTPGAGASVGTPLTLPGFRASPEGRRMIADYCIDAAFLAGVNRLAGRAGGTVPERRVGYILTTGGNWRAPIGRFRLVVDKGAPGNLVSFCGEGVRRISPTQFEMVKTNWRPERDLKVLVVGAD